MTQMAQIASDCRPTILHQLKFRDNPPTSWFSSNFSISLCQNEAYCVPVTFVKLNYTRISTHRVTDVDIDACVQTLNDLLV